MTTEQVKELQQELNDRGANLVVDGIWGAKSQATYDKVVALFGDAVQDGDNPDIVMNAHIGEQFGEYIQEKSGLLGSFFAKAGKYLNEVVNQPIVKELIKFKER